jgi:hypothetical protein
MNKIIHKISNRRGRERTRASRSIVAHKGLERVHKLLRMTTYGALCGIFLLTLFYWVQTPRTFASEPAQIGFPWDWSHQHLVFSKSTDPKVLAKIQQDPRLLHQRLRKNLPSTQASTGSTRRHGSFSAPLEHLAAALDVGLVTTAHAAQSQGKQPETLPLTAPPVRGVQIALVILGLSFAIAFISRRHWLPTMMIVLAILVFLMIASCGGTGTATPGLDTPSAPQKNNSSITANELHKDWAFSMSSLTAGTATAGSATTFPAKFSFDINAAPDCVNDYVTFNTSLPGASGGGGSGTPNIIALNQLYTSQAGGSPAGYCGTAGPSVMWSYFTGTGSVQTSVVLSALGDKAAFIETSTSTGAVLRILRGVAGEGNTITSPKTPTNGYVNTTVGASGNTAWNTTSCPNGQSCMISVPFYNANQDTNSSPFYNYAADTLYVGDERGVLHKFSGVFLGTPGEVVTGGWPITVDAGAVLTSPVLDGNSENIFVGDSAGKIWYIRETGSTSGSCASGTPPCLGSTDIALSGSIVDGPLVDSTSEHVFWFDGTDTVNNGEVVQTDTALGNVVTLAGVGGTSAGSPMFAGDFDKTYYNSSANSISGFLYFCGKDPTLADAPALWRVGFSSTGVMNATPDGGPTAYRTLVYSAMISNPPNVQCSPVTETYNTKTSTDWIFLSVANLNWPCNGQTGCVMSLDLTTLTTWPPTGTEGNGNTGITAFSDVSTGGTSGIIIDNDALTTPGNFPQASSIYFSWLAPAGTSLIGGAGSTFQCDSATTGGCFQKLTQNGLQ